MFMNPFGELELTFGLLVGMRADEELFAWDFDGIFFPYFVLYFLSIGEGGWSFDPVEATIAAACILYLVFVFVEDTHILNDILDEERG